MELPEVGVRTLLYSARVVVLLSAAMNLSAQSAPLESAAFPLMIAVVDSTPKGGALIFLTRDPLRTPHDVLVIHRSAMRPDRLSDAVVATLAVRASEGDVPSTRMRMRIRTSTSNTEKKYGKEAEVWMRGLSSARVRTIDGVGEARTLTLMVPAQRP